MYCTTWVAAWKARRKYRGQKPPERLLSLFCLFLCLTFAVLALGAFEPSCLRLFPCAFLVCLRFLSLVFLSASLLCVRHRMHAVESRVERSLRRRNLMFVSFAADLSLQLREGNKCVHRSKQTCVRKNEEKRNNEKKKERFKRRVMSSPRSHKSSFLEEKATENDNIQEKGNNCEACKGRPGGGDGT